MTRIATLALAVAAASPALAQIYVAPGLGYFVLNTIKPTNDPVVTIDPINADEGKFWLGRPTARTCTSIPVACEHISPSTVLSATSNSLENNSSPPTAINLATLSARSTNVQHVYIAGDGSLSYTEPGADVPSNAQVVDAFVYSPEERRTGYGTFKVDGRDFWACSSDASRNQWQISSGETGSTPKEGCSVVAISTRPYWQGVNIDFYNTTQS